MADRSKIEWCDATWNPVRGCSRVSEGCRNCYAERMAARFSDEGQPFHQFAHRWPFPGSDHGKPRWTGRVELIEPQLGVPLHWRKPRRIFVNSMSDLFHEALPFEYIALIHRVMWIAAWHEYLILTKRAARMVEFYRWLAREQPGAVLPMPHVRLGVSVEDQPSADERIIELLKLAAAGWKTMVSFEPLLSAINAELWLSRCGYYCDESVGHVDDRSVIGWVVCGPESGPGARAYELQWFRNLRDQSAAAGIAYFQKQLTDSRGRKIPFEQWPEDLLIRQFPEVARP